MFVVAIMGSHGIVCDIVGTFPDDESGAQYLKMNGWIQPSHNPENVRPDCRKIVNGSWWTARVMKLTPPEPITSRSPGFVFQE